jgi:hypothetical protein
MIVKKCMGFFSLKESFKQKNVFTFDALKIKSIK